MPKLFKMSGKIESIERLNCSVNGNPRFIINIGVYYLTTKSDYAYCYNIENLYNKQCTVDVEYYETKNSFRIETIKEVK